VPGNQASFRNRPQRCCGGQCSSTPISRMLGLLGNRRSQLGRDPTRTRKSQTCRASACFSPGNRQHLKDSARECVETVVYGSPFGKCCVSCDVSHRPGKSLPAHHSRFAGDERRIVGSGWCREPVGHQGYDAAVDAETIRRCIVGKPAGEMGLSPRVRAC
jgi:hypothetical protein